LLSHI